MKPINDLDANYIRSILRYEPDTGDFYWRYRDDAPATWNGRFAGQKVTNKHPNGRLRIGINYKAYLASRIAWVYMTGKWPLCHIDHEDTDKSNNRWLNLREADFVKNGQNTRRLPTNTSGLKGVSWHKSAEKWRATIVIDGKAIHLGASECRATTYFMYVIAANEHFGEFARFA